MPKELKRILYVEDEPDIQAVAKMALETLGGYEVAICSSGQEALDNAEAFGPDLLLLDVMMPGMDGVTTLHELRKLGPLAETPAIFMTAKVQPKEVEQLYKEGALEVIPKPFDPMTLADHIKACWNK